MFYLAVYDINTGNNDGKRRLNKVAKICENYGIRVQNSVFELELQRQDYIKIKNDIKNIIGDCDSVRFYQLGKDVNLEIVGCQNNTEITTDNAFVI